MRFAMEEEEESDEDESEEGEEDDELRKMKAAEEERRFAAEIGHSGRFNRFGPSGVDPYEGGPTGEAQLVIIQKFIVFL